MPKQTPKPEPAFEEALAELEALVDQLERGDLSLEDSLKSFERGVALTALCQRAGGGAAGRDPDGQGPGRQAGTLRRCRMSPC